MAKSSGYYNVDDFNEYKRKQEKCLPPRINVLAAACHIQEFLDAKKFTYGFMGGLPVLCLGYKRELSDLHIVYDEKDFERLKSKLENNRRIRLPTGMNPLLPFKALVWTGPEHKDQGCSINASVELDMVPSGACGTPEANVLIRSLVLLGLKTASGRQMVFKSLTVQYLLTTLLSYCKARDLTWDPRKDILFLCKNEIGEVQRVRTRLNVKELKEMFLGTLFFSRLHIQDQRLCYRGLLDTEPPPTMAITPPAPQPIAQPHPRPRVSEQPNESRAPRSRYRNANGARASSDGATENGAARKAQPESMDYLQDPVRATHIQGVQCVSSAKPNSISAAAAAKQVRKSMPNLTNPHKMTPALDKRPSSHEQQQQQPRSSPREGHKPSQSSPDGSHQDRRDSQLKYEGSFQPAHMRKTHHTEAPDQALSLGHRSMTSRTDSIKSDSTGTPVRGIQSQKGSLHVVSSEGEESQCQQRSEEQSTSTRGKFELVGSEGVYGAPAHTPRPTQPQFQHQRNSSAPPPQTFVFELDATSTAKPVFVVELPANTVDPLPAQRRDTQHEHLVRSAPVRPVNPRATFAPLANGALPASLVAGGLATQGQRQPLAHSEHQDESAFGFSTCQTNAYRYSSYTVPQSKGSSTPQVLSEETTGPVYKAYRPFVVTTELSRNDSVSSVYSPGHKRNISHDSHDSTASHESDKLAREYQELLNFEDGYGSN
ncbi:hypothetical protein E8E12_005683 [Didymella heteroderae]|uniref:Uncharacterized protein n=1 Tax=Didymella heteroderae TaxID=1769908 RepID=A0A9P5C1D2_9PLEO|nr:hypothetical protein E8E12_005683 [Didymella heteroderae]